MFLNFYHASFKEFRLPRCRCGFRTDVRNSGSRRGSPSRRPIPRAGSEWTVVLPAQWRATWKRRVVHREVRQHRRAVPTACYPRTRWNRSRIRIWWAWSTRRTSPRTEARPIHGEAMVAAVHGVRAAQGPSPPRYHLIYWTRCLWKPRTSTNRPDEIHSIPAESCKYRKRKVSRTSNGNVMLFRGHSVPREVVFSVVGKVSRFPCVRSGGRQNGRSEISNGCFYRIVVGCTGYTWCIDTIGVIAARYFVVHCTWCTDTIGIQWPIELL